MFYAHIKNGDYMYNNKSIWLDYISKDNINKLNKDLEVDVLIIGGGITGISTAYHLINSNIKVCLVEKNKLGHGVTSRTTGKLTYLQENYSKLKFYHGLNKTKLYLNSQKEAINIVKNIIEKENIECNLEKVSSYIFTNNSDKNFEKEKQVLKELNVNIKETNSLPNKEKIKDAYYVEDTYVFHPIKYVYNLKNICIKNNIPIYEDTKIISIDKKDNFYICKTKTNTIKTKQIVLAMHYPYFLIPFLMPVKVKLEKSYIEAFQVKKDYKFSSISISKPTISTRYHVDNNAIYQLYLTNSHNLCVKNNEKENFKELMSSKNNNPNFIWSNKDIMTNDALPFIGSINRENNLLIGTGYNTWGMTNGSIAGKVLADIILNKENKYIELFNPRRGLNIGKIINFPIILGSNAYSFIKSKISKNKSWYSFNVKFETRNGKSIAIYIDENKKEHIVYNLCPHMKCSLTFNEIEKTWDCSCHGSRFDIDGNCIEGPSNYNITYKE